MLFLVEFIYRLNLTVVYRKTDRGGIGMKLNPLYYLSLLIVASVVFFLGVANILETATPYTDILLTILVIHLIMSKVIEIEK